MKRNSQSPIADSQPEEEEAEDEAEADGSWSFFVVCWFVGDGLCSVGERSDREAARWPVEEVSEFSRYFVAGAFDAGDFWALFGERDFLADFGIGSFAIMGDERLGNAPLQVG